MAHGTEVYIDKHGEPVIEDVAGKTPTRQQLIDEKIISESDSEDVLIEKLFCLALCHESTDVISRVTRRYVQARDSVLVKKEWKSGCGERITKRGFSV